MKGQHGTQIKALSVLYVFVSLGAILGWYSIGDLQYFLHCVWKLTHEQPVSVMYPFMDLNLHSYLELALLAGETGKWGVMVPGLDRHCWRCQKVTGWETEWGRPGDSSAEYWPIHTAKIREIIILFWVIDGNLSSKSLLIHQIQRASWPKQLLKRITDHS